MGNKQPAPFEIRPTQASELVCAAQDARAVWDDTSGACYRRELIYAAQPHYGTLWASLRPKHRSGTGDALARPLSMQPALSPIAMPSPMEAKLVDTLPEGEGWQFEPKWDGFRAIAARRGAIVELMSKSGKSLARYFPEIVDLLRTTRHQDFTIDGELLLSIDGTLSFDALQQRLHPAASRIATLSRDTQARFMIFDILRMNGEDLCGIPLSRRRATLETFYRAEKQDQLLLSPATTDTNVAREWLDKSGGALDGIMGKRADDGYRSGERAMIKIKPLRSADCVVGGFRKTANGRGVASLLLGLLNQDGKLDHVGFTSGFSDAARQDLYAKLTPFEGGEGFSGKSPGGPSRWRKGEGATWTPLAPELVVEVGYDQVTGHRFRHGTRFLRWRPDKAPRQCTFEQLAPPLRPAELVELLERADIERTVVTPHPSSHGTENDVKNFKRFRAD